MEIELTSVEVYRKEPKKLLLDLWIIELSLPLLGK